MQNPSRTGMLYHAYQTHRDLAWPLEASARAAGPFLARVPPALLARPPARELAAARAVIELAQLTHCRPPFGIERLDNGAREVRVTEEATFETPFATLLRFRKRPAVGPEPRVLVVAPMSGHFATLLRETIRTLLPEHDVHVTDWHNALGCPGRGGTATERVLRSKSRARPPPAGARADHLRRAPESSPASRVPSRQPATYAAADR
jgi:polyhydroxyalkanoate depolymerase